MHRPLSAAVAVLIMTTTGCAGDSDEATAASPPTPSPARATPSPPGATPSPPPATTNTAAPTDSPCADPPCYASVVHIGVLTSDVVEQVSGMAASQQTPDLFYVVGDVPGTSEVAVVQDDGTLVARIEIEGMSARDAEALAVGPCAAGSPETCLFIGDIGNHVGLEDLFVYRVVEPDLTDPPSSLPAERLRYTYPDAPTDAEAMIVDESGRPLIISKAHVDRDSGVTGPTRLFRGSTEGGVLEDVGEIVLLEPENATFAAVVGHVVTGADADDGRVLLRTYDEVYEYRSDESDADLATFPDWPVRRVPAPFQVQSETVAYRLTGCGYLTTSELTGSIDAVTCE